MRVNINVNVDIDTEAWTLNYGVEGLGAIRSDVKDYGDALVRDHLRDLGLLASG